MLQKEGIGSQPDSPKEQGISSSFIIKEWTQDKGKEYFATDTSEVEELYDSIGAEGVHNRPTSSIVYSDLLSAPEDVPGSSEGATKEVPTGSNPKEPKLPEQFSANGRAELRKQFAQAPTNKCVIEGAPDPRSSKDYL